MGFIRSSSIPIRPLARRKSVVSEICSHSTQFCRIYVNASQDPRNCQPDRNHRVGVELRGHRRTTKDVLANIHPHRYLCPSRTLAVIPPSHAILNRYKVKCTLGHVHDGCLHTPPRIQSRRTSAPDGATRFLSDKLKFTHYALMRPRVQ